MLPKSKCNNHKKNFKIDNDGMKKENIHMMLNSNKGNYLNMSKPEDS